MEALARDVGVSHGFDGSMVLTFDTGVAGVSSS